MRQTVKNKPVSGGFYMNPLVGLYRFPRGEDLSYYKDNYEHYDEERKLNTQNWHTFTEDFEQNPYWIQNRIQSKEARTRLILSFRQFESDRLADASSSWQYGLFSG